MDKSQFLGLLFIFLILFFYFHFFSPKPISHNNKNFQNEKELIKYEKLFYDNSYNNLNENKKNFNLVFSNFISGKQKDFVLENNLIKVKFNSKGGLIKKVILKKYKDYNFLPLILLDSQSNEMFLEFIFNNVSFHTNDLFFETLVVNSIANKYQVAKLIFTLNISDNSYLRQIFSIPFNEYSIGYRLKFFGMKSYLDSDLINFLWHNLVKRLEKNINDSRNKSTINYYSKSNGFNHLNENSNIKEFKNIRNNVKWISIKQKFFTSGIISEKYFSKCSLSILPTIQDKKSLKLAMINLSFFINDFKEINNNFIFYFGPNLYEELYKINKSFISNISLGWPIIKWINKFFIISIFKFLNIYISNYGLIIVFLVLIIRFFLFPLSYRSYISTAKMRILKPELDLIKLNSNDIQEVQMKQMKLYKDSGINPLSGCIPVLLQMPILLAMFNFFPNIINFRQKSFLWSEDLSTYDSIYNFSFIIPWYGNHVSMFTLLMSLSSTLLYSSSKNDSNNQNSMKIFSYIMPLGFMFILNSFSSGLIFYYFVSNLFTFIQQIIIRFFLNEDSIVDQLKKSKKNK